MQTSIIFFLFLSPCAKLVDYGLEAKSGSGSTLLTPQNLSCTTLIQVPSSTSGDHTCNIKQQREVPGEVYYISCGWEMKYPGLREIAHGVLHLLTVCTGYRVTNIGTYLTRNMTDFYIDRNSLNSLVRTRIRGRK